MTFIRPAREQDLDMLVSLLRLLFTIEEDFGIDAAKQRRGLAMLLGDERACILVAEQDGEIVGMCTGQLVTSTAEGGPSVLVEDVVVAQEYRGENIGRSLMEALTVWAKSCGASRMQLLADKNNPPALAFYHRLGWGTTAMICLRRHIKPDNP